MSSDSEAEVEGEGEQEQEQEYDHRVDPAYVEALQRKVELLEQRQDRMATRIAQLEDDGSSSSSSSSSSGEIGTGVDSYDEKALANLTPGQKVTLAKLRSAYQSTGIKNKTTLRSRIKTITQQPAFTYDGGNTWVYEPETDPEESVGDGDE